MKKVWNGKGFDIEPEAGDLVAPSAPDGGASLPAPDGGASVAAPDGAAGAPSIVELLKTVNDLLFRIAELARLVKELTGRVESVENYGSALQRRIDDHDGQLQAFDEVLSHEHTATKPAGE